MEPDLPERRRRRASVQPGRQVLREAVLDGAVAQGDGGRPDAVRCRGPVPGDGDADSIRAVVDDPVQGTPSNRTATRAALTDPQATMKIIQLTYDTAFGMPDFGEANLVQLLTGWHPVVYSTQPTFKEQETAMLILEELQKGNTPDIEYETAEKNVSEELSSVSSSHISLNGDNEKDHRHVQQTPTVKQHPPSGIKNQPPNQATLDAMRAAGAPQAIIDALAQGTLPSSGGPPSSAMIEAMKAGGAPPAVIDALMKKGAAGQPAKTASTGQLHNTADTSKAGALPSATPG